jgi:hypothetical protein
MKIINFWNKIAKAQRNWQGYKNTDTAMKNVFLTLS